MTVETENHLALVRESMNLLVRAADTARENLANLGKKHRLSANEIRVLLILEEPLKGKEIAQALGTDPSYITSLATSLEGARLVERVAGTDRRVKLMGLTERGVTVRQELMHALPYQGPAAHRMSDLELCTLIDLLKKLQ
ncbi:MAG: MarR family transcriptional regulator [Rothia sp. (in: high G+C Gram-positive bacteria)]|uniref:MarR family winged helix-turn-helix transcriptional regulator n=1 Tax=Rothia sp. (in: high G+C Gram-positive bacteria) TaxID=1885016 RepID=UPI0026E0B58C|nr:MarR family transcriptional regulator [Rothia sp. (in: high G+C Gram-positive bacteria)]MDO5749735.1 MarR family transcriptional regulator [Rothia sp. (in: high G+C Gram-positive bacteria)]